MASRLNIRLALAGGFFQIAILTAAAEPVIQSPQAYQVIQREGFDPTAAPVNQPGPYPRGSAEVSLAWTAEVSAGDWEARVVLQDGSWGKPVEWTKLVVQIQDTQHKAVVRVPAGGWYRLELRQARQDEILQKNSVEPFGVGEVFLIAGQSYAVGANDENLKVTEPGRRVAAFNWRDKQWQICDDPVPHAGPKGSIWPALGDLLAPVLKVPVGFVNAAVGGTSTRQWAVDGPLFADLIAAGQKTGNFRAVLWQQGESDVIEHTPAETYVARVISIRAEAMRQWGREVPWLPAKSTLHPTVYRVPEREESIRNAIQKLWSEPGFRPGPDTDVLDDENRGDPQSMRHFSGIGQRRAALLWFAALWTELHRPPNVEQKALPAPE